MAARKSPWASCLYAHRVAGARGPWPAFQVVAVGLNPASHVPLLTHLLSPVNTTSLVSFVWFWRFFFFSFARTGNRTIERASQVPTSASPSPVRTFQLSFVLYLLTSPLPKQVLTVTGLGQEVRHGAKGGVHTGRMMAPALNVARQDRTCSPHEF